MAVVLFDVYGFVLIGYVTQRVKGWSQRERVKEALRGKEVTRKGLMNRPQLQVQKAKLPYNGAIN